MICNKKEKRSFYNLFKIFSCSNCNNEIKYEYIYIGNNTINLYFLNNECINNIKKQNMIRFFLIDSLRNDNDLYFVLDKKEYYIMFEYLPLIIDEFNCNIYIIIL